MTALTSSQDATAASASSTTAHRRRRHPRTACGSDSPRAEATSTRGGGGFPKTRMSAAEPELSTRVDGVLDQSPATDRVAVDVRNPDEGELRFVMVRKPEM